MISFDDLKLGRDYLFTGFVHNSEDAIVTLVAKGYTCSQDPFIVLSADVVDLSGRPVPMSFFITNRLSEVYTDRYCIVDIDSSFSSDALVYLFGSVGISCLREL